MDPLLKTFNDRLQEIDIYLDLLDALERQLHSGPPTIGGSAITAEQQKILYSSVYLQLYNLVEATVTWCMSAVARAAASSWYPQDLSDQIRREWIRATIRSHLEQNSENRLDAAVRICQHLIDSLPVPPEWQIVAGGGGNWDDKEIEDVTNRIGIALKPSPDVYRGVKRHVRDDQGPLELVRGIRNKLAHGVLSFVECGAGVTVRDLRDIRNRIANYLKEVIDAFDSYISAHEFLNPSKRPATATTGATT